jgi:hypothetical protein
MLAPENEYETLQPDKTTLPINKRRIKIPSKDKLLLCL